MRKILLIGGGLLLGGAIVAAVFGFYLSQRSPSMVNQTIFEPILDPDSKPSAYLCCLTFREEGGRGWQYGVVTYGRKVRLMPGPGSFKVLVDGTTVEVSPANDGLWTIGPDHQFHRLGVSFRDLNDNMAPSEPDKLMNAPVWKDRLKPPLEKYRWPEK
jgi:hypothetical protein